MSHVLIVDDEPGICWGMEQLLRDEGYTVSVASSAEEAFSLIETAVPDVVFLDVRLPGQSGLQAMDQLHLSIPGTPVIVMTAYGDLETAVRTVHSGAFDYLPKPFDLEAAVGLVERAVSSRQPATSTKGKRSASTPLVGTAPAMQEVFKHVAIAARSDVPVLITGESGTGKELVARAVHQHSPRADQPLVILHLAALSPQLIESELFGHVKGAFTGADSHRVGALEEAQGGTVFLDEVADMPADSQVKLLRAIELQEVCPVGSSQPRQVDFRVIAATNQPLNELVAMGRFRRDLFYRLAVFPVSLPPLRERTPDIPELAETFLNEQPQPRPIGFTEEALRELQRRAWPGNVRELRNLVQHVALLNAADLIDRCHLPDPLETVVASSLADPTRDLQQAVGHWVHEQLQAGDDTDEALAQLLDVVEPVLLTAVLKSVDGNRMAAAARLGIHRETLRQKLRKHGID